MSVIGINNSNRVNGLDAPPECHLPNDRLTLTSSLSSTWGRADRHTSHDSNRVWGILFCGLMLAAARADLHSPVSGFNGNCYGPTTSPVSR
jgi:hypothetical protein